MSWDNLYSRGPMSRRPDHLLVWSEEMGGKRRRYTSFRGIAST